MQLIGPVDSEPVLFALARRVEESAGVAGLRPPDAL